MVYAALITSVFLGACGHILCKIGTGQSSVINQYILFGITCYGLSFISFLPWLSSRPAGIAVPAAALTYILVNLWEVFTGKNTLNINLVLGLILVIIGLTVLNYKYN